MNSLFIDIRKKLIENENDTVFSDFYIDENYGQLDSENNSYPCILLDIVETEWDNLVHGTQVGACAVKVSLAFDCKKEFGDLIEEEIKNREMYFNSMHRLLHNFATENCTPLIRKSFQTQTLPDFIKVYECTYTCTLKETDVSKETGTKRVSSISIEPKNELSGRFSFPELENME